MVLHEEYIFTHSHNNSQQKTLYSSKDSLSIAGELVPVWNTVIKERYETELQKIAKKSRSLALLFKRSNTYFPIIETILKKEGVPTDLKYIAIVESGLQNKMSKKSAAGFWQLMPKTAEYLDLTLHEEIDERLHLEKSTRAAARLLKIYYRQFGSWANAIAAYNLGADRLTLSLKNQKEEKFYNLFTNKETSQFLFKILAYKSIFESPEQYGFLPIRQYGRYMLPTKKIEIIKPIPSLALWADSRDIHLEELRALNPWLKSNSVNKINAEQPVILWIPTNATKNLIASTKINRNQD